MEVSQEASVLDWIQVGDTILLAEQSHPNRLGTVDVRIQGQDLKVNPSVAVFLQRLLGITMGAPCAAKRLLPWSEVKRRVPFTRQYLLQLEKAGMFPRRLQLGPNRIAWLDHEIDAWIEARAAERKAA